VQAGGVEDLGADAHRVAVVDVHVVAATDSAVPARGLDLGGQRGRALAVVDGDVVAATDGAVQARGLDLGGQRGRVLAHVDGLRVAGGSVAVVVAVTGVDRPALVDTRSAQRELVRVRDHLVGDGPAAQGGAR